MSTFAPVDAPVAAGFHADPSGDFRGRGAGQDVLPTGDLADADLLQEPDRTDDFTSGGFSGPSDASSRKRGCHVRRTVIPFGIMLVRSIRHRGLRRLLEDDNPRFLPQNLVVRVRNILTVLVLVRDMEEFAAFARPGWRIHRLSGERQNEWSISVSGNWRVTFAEMDGAIERLNLEDYH